MTLTLQMISVEETVLRAALPETPGSGGSYGQPQITGPDTRKIDGLIVEYIHKASSSVASIGEAWDALGNSFERMAEAGISESPIVSSVRGNQQSVSSVSGPFGWVTSNEATKASLELQKVDLASLTDYVSKIPGTVYLAEIFRNEIGEALREFETLKKFYAMVSDKRRAVLLVLT